MRILCSTTPMDGVFGPFVPLGRAFIDAGHQVMVATGPDLAPKVERLGFAAAVAGPTAMEGAVTAMSDPEVQAAGAGERWRFPATMFGRVIPSGKVSALRAIAAGFQPDLVIHPSVDAAGPLVAAELGVASICYGFMHPLEPAVVRGIAEQVEPMWAQAGLEPDPHAGIYRCRYLDPCPPSMRCDRGVAAPVTEPVRPEVPGDSSDPLPDWAAGLGKRPTLYVSLGTVPLFNQPSRFQSLIEELVDDEIELIVTVSELHDPAALGPLPDYVHVEQWLPLAALLPRCDAVLCHAGSGTTLAALAAGVPLVLAPDGADQFINARSCEAAGVARVLAPETITPSAVRDAARAVLAADAPERAAAARIAGEIAAMPGADSVVARLGDPISIGC